MPAKLMLLQKLRDNSADVQIVAAEALTYMGNEQQALAILMKQLTHPSAMVRIHAANVLKPTMVNGCFVLKMLTATVQSKVPETVSLIALNTTVSIGTVPLSIKPIMMIAMKMR